jgi:hypothetical protein
MNFFWCDDISATPNEDRWVECRTHASQKSALWLIGLLIFCIIILLYFGVFPVSVKVGIVVFGVILAGFIMHKAFVLSSHRARTEYGNFQLYIDETIARGRTRSDAVNAYAGSVGKSRDRAAVIHGATIQAIGSVLGFSALGGLLGMISTKYFQW